MLYGQHGLNGPGMVYPQKTPRRRRRIDLTAHIRSVVAELDDLLPRLSPTGRENTVGPNDEPSDERLQTAHFELRIGDGSRHTLPLGVPWAGCMCTVIHRMLPGGHGRVNRNVGQNATFWEG